MENNINTEEEVQATNPQEAPIEEAPIEETPIEETTAAAPETEATEPEVKHESKAWLWLALGSLLLCVLAWIVSPSSGYGALSLAIVSMVLGFISLKSKRHAIRNTAITAIIASGVLALVVGAFIIALKKFLGE